MTALVWIATAVAVLTLIGVHWGYWVDEREVRRDSSRFPLFAVRDRLILMVANGDMSEDDRSWQLTYIAVNYYLDLSTNRTVLSVLLNRAQHAKRMRDADVAAAAKTIGEVLDRDARKNPEFSKVLDRMGTALDEMTRARTPDWQWLMILMIALAVYPVVFIKRQLRGSVLRSNAASASAAVWLNDTRGRERLAA